MTHDERVYHHLYVESKSPLENAERIAALEELTEGLQAENAKLRERIHELEMEGSDHFYRTAYAEDANRTLEAENAKLRELVRRLISHVEHPPCEGCGFEMNCDGEHVTQCDEWLFMIADARKLGVEVDG